MNRRSNRGFLDGEKTVFDTVMEDTLHAIPYFSKPTACTTQSEPYYKLWSLGYYNVSVSLSVIAKGHHLVKNLGKCGEYYMYGVREDVKDPYTCSSIL